MKDSFSRLSTWIEGFAFDWTPYNALGKRIHLAKNTYLFHQDDPVQSVYAVLEGRISLSLSNELGDEKTMMIVGANGLVGETGFLADSSTGHTAAAMMVSDGILVGFDRDTFHQLFMTHPHLAEFVWFSVNKKLSILAKQSVELSYATAQYRVVQLLLELADTYGVQTEHGTQISIKFTQQEMANLAGTTRVTVSQVFRLLSERQLLSRENGYICVASTEPLRNLLENPKASHFDALP